MKARHARQIRRGISYARELSVVLSEDRRIIYREFMDRATPLEWKAFRSYRFKHWTW